jgi:putative DNA primase/helicase
MQRAIETVRSIPSEADGLTERRARQAIRAHALRSESLARLKAIIEVAKSDERVLVDQNALDAHGLLLNVLNGTVDQKISTLRPYRREDLLTKIAPVHFDPTATAPTWHGFLERVQPDPAVRAFLQRYTGYAATGDTSEQTALFLHGSGANGKTTFLETVRYVLGDYAANTPFETFLATKDSGPREDLFRLRGRRLVTAAEPEKDAKLSTATLKRLTGGDILTARELYGHFAEFAPTAKIILAFNHLLTVEAQDWGTWRRILLVLFGVKIPEAEKDKHLDKRLRAEAPGILNWLIRGCLDYQREGLNPPAAVLDATAEYRRQQDPLGDFLERRCRLGFGERCAPSDLYMAYRTWAEQSGERPMSSADFCARLRERDLIQHRNGKARWWEGIGLRNELASASDGQPSDDESSSSPVVDEVRI